jgi:alditol oxidase
MTKQSNWAGNYEYNAVRIYHPKTVEEVQELVIHSRKVRALGTRHSFNTIADSPENLISLDNLDQVINLDKESLTVTVAGGIRYGQLSQYLHQQGFALHNLASLPHISIAGACATATHGSGNNNGNLATAVSAMELVTADGEVIVVSDEQDGDKFQGMVVGLGAFGVVIKLTLNIQPAFDLRQDVYQNLPVFELKDHFDEITSSAYSVSLFTDWKSETFNQVWLKRHVVGDLKLQDAPSFFSSTLAKRNLHPIEEISAESCTEQMGVPGPWHERLPHFRMGHTPSSGEELQSEYFVPRQNAYEALLEISRLRGSIAPLLQISEIRTIAADGLWMSPCYNQDSVAIHFTWKKNASATRKILPQIEERLARFHVRPHWGKLFEMSPTRLMSRYEKLQDFRELLSKYDPEGKFCNSFLDSYIFGTD